MMINLIIKFKSYKPKDDDFSILIDSSFLFIEIIIILVSG